MNSSNAVSITADGLLVDHTLLITIVRQTFKFPSRQAVPQSQTL